MPNNDIGHDKDPPLKGPDDPETATTGTRSAEPAAGEPEPVDRKGSSDDVQS